MSKAFNPNSSIIVLAAFLPIPGNLSELKYFVKEPSSCGKTCL